MSGTESADTTRTLLAQRHVFKAFLVSRLGNEADAEDLLQNGLVKAMERSGEIRDGQKAVAWFYQVLRNAVVDHVRSRQAADKRNDVWARELAAAAPDSETEKRICACFEKLLPTLKPAQADLIRRVELQGASVGDVAKTLGMTPNYASVSLHRARGELRTKLMQLCGDCACLDQCDCD